MSAGQTGGVCVKHLLLLVGVGACLFQPSATAAVPETPAISCSVTREAGDMFRYQLSRPPALPGCVRGWENENKTVIVHDTKFNEDLVQTLTNQSIVTRSCWDYLHYTEDCPGGWNESHCKVDCKSLSEQHASPQPTVTSSASTPPETWCQDRLTCGFTIGFGIVGAVVVLGLIIWCICSKCSKCKKSTDEII